MIRRVLQGVRAYFALIVVAATYGLACLAIASYRAEQTPPDAIVLRMGHWQLEASVREAIDDMARRYRERVNPRVYVVQDAIPESVYGTWVSTQLMGGTAPDIMEVGKGLPAPVWLSYQNRYFVPLTRYVNAPNPHNQGGPLEGVPLRQTYKDGMRNAYVDEMQEYMSVPLSMFGVRIFYNKDLLRRLTGLEAPPTEYRAFLDACRKIGAQRDARGQFYVPIASSAYHFDMWKDMMFDPLTYPAVRRVDFNRDGNVGNDELFVGFKTGRIDFGFPAYRARFQMQREVTQYFQPGYTGLTRVEAVFLFAQQRAVFMTTGTWDARSLEEQARDSGFAVGVMDFPRPTQDDPVYGAVVEGPIYERPGGGFPFGITRASRHAEVALDFLLFMASQGENEALNRMIGWIPVIQGTQMDPLLKAFEPHLEGVYSAIPITLGGETLIRWNQLFSLYQLGQISYEDMTQQYEAFYREYGLKDFLEQQRDWRRGMQRNELFLAGIRARALASTGDEQLSSWVKYRALTAQRQVWAELDHSRQVSLLNQGVDPKATGPYEYSPQVIEEIRARLKSGG